VAALVLVAAACGPSTAKPSGSVAGSPAASGPATAPSAQAGVVEIRWFCCLGGGDAQEQVAEEKRIVEEFNASHPNIHVTFEVTAYAGARDALSTQIASGNGPDIVGPVGIGGAEAFHGQWLDLKPYIDKAGYDMSQFPQSTVDLYNVGGEGQLGIPFAVYPSILYYKADHFKEAGLNEPPHAWGGKYKMPDGSEVPWDYKAAREIGMKLTVDKNGKDATEAGFDPTNIVQWGFEPQRDDLRQTGAYWQAGKLASGTDGKTVDIPVGWQDAWKWFYDGMWKDHFAMTGPQFQSTDFNPSDYPFFTGNVSMSQNYLWAS
jgi:multiple sugar transport system substrate-binding protein